jgi:hypothetical protein
MPASTAVWSALADAGIHERHRVVEANGRPALDLLAANGIRPDSTLGNVTELQSDGRLDLDRFSVNVNYGIPQKRFFVGGNYQLSRLDNFTDEADAVNRAKHGLQVTFAANQHINPTNICTLRKTCVFCSYARLPKEDGAYRYTMDQVWAEAAAATCPRRPVSPRVRGRRPRENAHPATAPPPPHGADRANRLSAIRAEEH